MSLRPNKLSQPSTPSSYRMSTTDSITIPINSCIDNDNDSIQLIDIKEWSRSDLFINLALRIRNHPYTIYIYISLLLCNISAVIIQYVYNTSHWVVVCIEVLLNTTLILEVLINIMAVRWSFFESRMNIIDLFLTVCCTVFAGIFIYDEYINKSSTPGLQSNNEINDDIYSEIDFVLLSLRYMFQIGRFSSLINRSKVSANRLIADDIHLMNAHSTSQHHINQLMNTNNYYNNNDIQLSNYDAGSLQHNSILSYDNTSAPPVFTNNMYMNSPVANR